MSTIDDPSPNRRPAPDPAPDHTRWASTTPDPAPDRHLFNATVDPSTIDQGFELGFEAVVGEGGARVWDVPQDVMDRNRATINHWAPIWLRYSSLLAELINEDFAVDRRSLQPTRNANVEAATCQAEDLTTAIIVATGPSLEQQVDLLRRWKGVILAAPTALPFLLAHGVRPHYTVAIDANPDIGDILSGYPYAKEGVRLLTPPTSDYATPAAFPSGSRFWFKSFILARNGLNHPFNLYMSLFYPWIENFIYQAGCVTNAMYLLTTLLNAGGQHAIEKVFLFGADFGYPDGLSRIPSYRWCKGDEVVDGGPARWIPRPRDPLSTRVNPSLLRTAANGVLTDSSMLGYKRSLYSVWGMEGVEPFRTDDGSLHPHPCLYNCSPRGILFELPTCDAQEVVDSQGRAISRYGSDVVVEVFNRYMSLTGKVEGQIDPSARYPSPDRPVEPSPTSEK